MAAASEAAAANIGKPGESTPLCERRARTRVRARGVSSDRRGVALDRRDGRRDRVQAKFVFRWASKCANATAMAMRGCRISCMRV